MKIKPRTKIKHILYHFTSKMLRKKCKAYYTVENAIIVPLFFMIYIISASVSIYIHDRIVLRNALEQAAIEYEYQYINSRDAQNTNTVNSSTDNKNTKENEEDFALRVKEYIDTKTLFLNDIEINISNKETNVKISAKAKFPLVTAYVGKTINTSQMVSVNNPKKWIRITKALKEAVD